MKLSAVPEGRHIWHFNRIWSPAPLCKLLALPERLAALTVRLQAEYPEVIDVVVELPSQGGRGHLYATTEKWSDAVPAIPGYQAIPSIAYREQVQIFPGEDPEDEESRWWDDILHAPRISVGGWYHGDEWVGPHPEIVAAAETAMARFKAELPERIEAGLGVLEAAMNAQCARREG